MYKPCFDNGLIFLKPGKPSTLRIPGGGGGGGGEWIG